MADEIAQELREIALGVDPDNADRLRALAIKLEVSRLGILAGDTVNTGLAAQILNKEKHWFHKHSRKLAAQGIGYKGEGEQWSWDIHRLIAFSAGVRFSEEER